MKFLDGFRDHIYALFRIVAGFLFIWHGTQKFFNFPVAYPWGPLDPMTTTAGVIEIVGGTMIMLGLLTRPAAFISSGLMAVAYWMAHATRGLYPIGNGGELAIMFCFAFLFIAASGPGKWSLDKS